MKLVPWIEAPGKVPIAVASLMVSGSRDGDMVLVKVRTPRDDLHKYIFHWDRARHLLKSVPDLPREPPGPIPAQPEITEEDWRTLPVIVAQLMHCAMAGDSFTIWLRDTTGPTHQLTLPPTCLWLLVDYLRHYSQNLRE